MGCDLFVSPTGFYKKVSIHAPTWGATENGSSISLYLKCFNPRTHMGCDASRTIKIRGRWSFNPRTHMGCDRKRLRIVVSRLVFQSTHPRGVRPSSSSVSGCSGCFNPRTHVGCDSFKSATSPSSSSFNPRTHVGCDSELVAIAVGKAGFNPRTHVGCDQERWRCCRKVMCFNPRTHVGCDKAPLVGLTTYSVSIHAPTWGATPQLGASFTTVNVSIHAPTWGATRVAVLVGHARSRFNPRTHVGCDDREGILREVEALFQSTHPRGVRPFRTSTAGCLQLFQSTHPRGVRPSTRC